MNKERFAVRSMLGWLLLAACVILAAAGALAGHSVPQSDMYTALERRTEMERIPLQRGEVAVNTADAAALDALPGVGESTALAIVEEREANGPFFYPEDLLHVHGIGKGKLEEMRPLLDMTGE